MANENKEITKTIVGAGIGAALIYTAVRLLGLIYQIILMRLLGGRSMGYYTVASETYQVLVLISSGCIPAALTMATSSYLSKKEYKNITVVFKSARKYAFVMGALFAAAVFVGAPKIADFAFSIGDVSVVLRFMAPALFISAVLSVYRGLYQCRGSMVPTIVSQIIEQAVCVIVGMIAVTLMIGKGLAMGAAGGMLGLNIGALAALIFCLVLYRRYQVVVRRQDKSDRESKRISKDAAFKKFIGVMLPIIFCQLAFELEEITDAVLFNKALAFVGYPDDVRIEMFGIYTGEYRVIINILLTSLIYIAMIKAPELKRLHKKKKFEVLNSNIEWMIRLTMSIAIPFCVFFAILSEPIIHIIFKDINELPSNLLMVGAPAAILYALAAVTNLVLQNVWRRKAVALNSLIALALDAVVVGVLLIFTDMNVYALVYGSYVFTLASCILNLGSMEKYLGYKQHYVQTFISPIIASLMMGFASWIIYQGTVVITRSDLLGVLLAFCVAVALYMLLVIIFGVFSEEELLGLPMGERLVSICKKIHIL